ncbi:chitin synthase-domain-containing protein [Aspergillus avenaceus]|uniref:Chitin synthase n=1 Tax=Aspergillus avenaceus TaxID=36643 RepID=A0A5N6TT70_ASPAV|nr:chitin synthase-domain-containing protein [Aspergillus avenaceus]
MYIIKTDDEAWEAPISHHGPHYIEYNPDNISAVIHDAHSEPTEEKDDSSQEPQPYILIRRQKPVHDVGLSKGNLVLNWPIPRRILDTDSSIIRDDEFTHLRYTAVTCEPVEFRSAQFTLRQQLFPVPRHTEILVVVSLKDEDAWSLNQTIESLCNSIDHICSMTSEKMWQHEGWKKIVVCVVGDGRSVVKPRTKAALASLGVYQDGIARESVVGKEVTAHIYEHTTQIRVEWEDSRQVSLKLAARMPIQMLFCLKEQSRGRVDTLDWVIRAFGNVIEPTMCVFLDPGTIVKKEALYHLWRALESEPLCAAACGQMEIRFSLKSFFSNPLPMVYHFEQKWNSVVDQPFASVIGFAKVMPSGMSAYRYLALHNDDGPISRYLAGAAATDSIGSRFRSQLAGSAMFPLEILTQRHYRWLLRYVRASETVPGIPYRIGHFLEWQQETNKRDFYASVYGIANLFSILRCQHSILRKSLVVFSLLHHVLELVMLWFSIGNLYAIFHLLSAYLCAPDLAGNAGFVIGRILTWFYWLALFISIIQSFSSRPSATPARLHLSLSFFWAVVGVWILFAFIYIAARTTSFNTTSYNATVSNMRFFICILPLPLIYAMGLLIFTFSLEPWHMLISWLVYTLFLPFKINHTNTYLLHSIETLFSNPMQEPDLPEKLPAVTSIGGRIRFGDGDLDIDDAAIDAKWYSNVMKFAAPPARHREKRDPGVILRTVVLSTWVFSNFAIAGLVTNLLGPGWDYRRGKKFAEDVNMESGTIYIGVVLWGVSWLVMVKWMGGLWYRGRVIFDCIT